MALQYAEIDDTFAVYERAHRVLCIATMAIRPGLAFVGGVGLILAFSAPTASASELDWSAPPECPSAAEVARAARDLAAPGAQPKLTARVEVSEVEAGRWHVHIEDTLGGRSWSRDLEAESCEALANATALILAAAGAVETPGPRANVETVDPGSRDGDGAATRGTTAGPTTASSQTTAPSLSLEPSSTPSTGVAAPRNEQPFTTRPSGAASPWASFRAAPMFSCETGLLPHPAPGNPRAGVGVPSALRIEPEAGMWAMESGTVAASPADGGRFQLMAARPEDAS